MTGSSKAALAASLLVLASCGGGGGANESANQAAAPANAADANPTAPAPAADVNQAAATPAAAPADGSVTREYLVGRWTEAEMNDCAQGVTEFRADGTFAFPWGDTGQWTLNGDQLTMTGNSNALTVRAVDANTLEVRSPSRTYQNKRCT